MRILSLTLLLGAVCSSPIFASPCVVGDTLANYELLGATGCTIPGTTELVNDFNFLVTSTNLVSPLTAAAVTVTPSATGGIFQLAFRATGGTSATGFTVSSGFFAKYEIGFNWDPLVVGAEDDMVANTPVNPGTATVTTAVCAGQAFGGALCPTTASPTNTLTVFNDGIPGDAINTATTAFASSVQVVGTSSVVDLESNGASSTISGFNTSVFTPEPATALLFGAGLLALSRRLFRRGF